MANGFSKGDKVAFHDRNGSALKGTYDHHCPNGKAYIKGENGMSYERTYGKFTKIADGTTDFQVSTTNTNHAVPIQSSQWDINERFSFLSQLVRMVLNKTAVSLIITGEGGLGKTYTVRKELSRRHLMKDNDYKYIKGFSTAKGLYRTLYENKDKLVIFDDADEVLVNDIAKNILKGALDSYDEREISWITHMSDESLPDSFIFTGQVIFISNKSQQSIDNALLSRSMCIDLTMTPADKIHRMEFIMDKKEFMPDVTIDIKRDALNLIKDNMLQAKEISLRSLEKVIKLRLGQLNDDYEYDDKHDMVQTDWKLLAKYMIVN